MLYCQQKSYITTVCEENRKRKIKYNCLEDEEENSIYVINYNFSEKRAIPHKEAKLVQVKINDLEFGFELDTGALISARLERLMDETFDEEGLDDTDEEFINEELDVFETREEDSESEQDLSDREDSTEDD
ncbi:hypothetical protein JTB14_005544 [Gonioctena quinquepunctata]|nr:hypothetical protein JTB14_005544 [Gonioctena quinquepunctata]